MASPLKSINITVQAETISFSLTALDCGISFPRRFYEQQTKRMQRKKPEKLSLLSQYP
jgi:hypothetical protein